MRYELHCHTNHSICSNLTPSLVLKTAKNKGLNGICIVDHDSFEGANSVEKLNKDKNFMVIKGTEFSTSIGHLTGIFLKKEIKYDKRKKSVEWLIDEIHKQNGLVILPHPGTVTRLSKLDIIDISKYNIDAVEAFNARNIFSYENKRALKLANQLGKPIVCGSDAHFSSEIGRNTVECDDLHYAIKNCECRLNYKNHFFNIFSLYFILASALLKKIKRTN